jgi:transposase
MDTTPHARPKKVRQHPAELRAAVLAQCALPSASVAKIAREHGLNANLVHAWRRQQSPPVLPRPDDTSAAAPPAGEFIALALAQPSEPAAGGDIRIELRRGAITVSVSWPLQAADACATWLGQWLR